MTFINLLINQLRILCNKQASHLLKYDSMLGTFKAEVKIVDNETISVDGKPIKVVSSRDPLKLPWAELGIDIVIEVSCAINSEVDLSVLWQLFVR